MLFSSVVHRERLELQRLELQRLDRVAEAALAAELAKKSAKDANLEPTTFSSLWVSRILEYIFVFSNLGNKMSSLTGDRLEANIYFSDFPYRFIDSTPFYFRIFLF